MNYHIITQEKFFDEYIEDIYRLHLEDNNVIWVRGNKGDSKLLTTSHPVEYLGNNRTDYLKRLSSIQPEDRLFISWYDSFIGGIVLQSKIQNPIYVYLMGAEFYSQPEWWHTGWLLDNKTKRKVYEERLLPRFFPKAKPWRWYRCINWFSFKKRLKKRYLFKLKTIKRIDYIVITEHSGKEVELVKKLYPGCHAEHVIGCFGQNFELASTRELKPIPEEIAGIKVLFGNSSDPTGNHLDALSYLKKKVKSSVDIFSFLSYGDAACRQWVVEYGSRLFGDRFHPVLQYMGREEFVDFMQTMDVVMMYHNRQQAEGNIMTALVLGKPVFMKTTNPQYFMLKSMGVKPVYDVQKMHETDLIQAIRDAQKFREETMSIIDREYSRESRLLHLRDLLC